jgi:hypothetical protein
MIVVCKKGSKKLIKGHQYKAVNIWNDGTSYRYLEGKLKIEKLGMYSVSNFTTIDGKEIPKIKIDKIKNQVQEYKFSDLKVGDILVCQTNNLSLFAKGHKYKISELSSKETEYISYNGKKYKNYINKIKFVGINRFINFNYFYFRKLNDDEKRDISLNSLLENKEPDYIKTKTRKIDLVDNKDLVLMSILSKSILDVNRHHLSIVEWGCKKINRYGIKIDDYEDLLNMKLKDILKKIEK